jgi:hypothetical protein
MAFEKAFTKNYNELTDETRYRFAEIEIARTINQLRNAYQDSLQPTEMAVSFLYRAIIPKAIAYEETEEMFYRAMLASTTRQPSKKELIHYMIAHGQSYNKTRDLLGVSFNTISNAKYDTPIYFPTFMRWNPEMLYRWNTLKQAFNVWNEDLVHSDV